MKSPKHFFSIILLSGILLSPEVFSQHKFELGANIDPLVVPINAWTFVENGPMYYDIKGKVSITQAGSLYLQYWPFTAVGISVGIGYRNFQSSVDYHLTDPFNDIASPDIERSHPFKATGWGPTFSVLWRMDKWKARIGLGYFDLQDRQFTPSAITSWITAWEDGEVFLDIRIEEQAYWYTAPISYAFLQFEGQYTVVKNLYVKLGFETTLSGPQPYPYTILISGFTPNTSQQEQLLNDFKMRNSLATFSFGVGYTLGFGKYKNKMAEN